MKKTRRPDSAQRNSTKLVLASGSPRRREILRTAGIPFKCVPSRIVERPPRRGELPEAYTLRLAAEKARSILPRVSGCDVVLGADTVVCIEGRILGKPRSHREAVRMLKRLSGKSHWVLTGVVLQDCRTNHIISWCEKTRVTFSRLTPEEIQDYVNSGEPFDKAGAYAVQGKASKFVRRIEGCFFNIVGLPIAAVQRHLQRLLAHRR